MYYSHICHDIIWLLKSDDILWWYTLFAFLWWHSLIVFSDAYKTLNLDKWSHFYLLWDKSPMKILWSMFWISNHESQLSSFILISIFVLHYFTICMLISLRLYYFTYLNYKWDWLIWIFSHILDSDYKLWCFCSLSQNPLKNKHGTPLRS